MYRKMFLNVCFVVFFWPFLPVVVSKDQTQIIIGIKQNVWWNVQRYNLPYTFVLNGQEEI